LNFDSQARSEVAESAEKPCNPGESAAGAAARSIVQQTRIRARFFMLIGTSVQQGAAFHTRPDSLC
jgi:hypothetical protein